MYGRRYATAAALALVFACGAVLGGKFLATAQTRTQPGARGAAAAPQRWEYASLTRAAYPGSARGGLYWISYFGPEGVRVVEVEEQATERGGPAKAIAQLGAEGWEMVGQGPLEIRQGGLNALYFKRPKN
jgi:hypothetical protein